MVGVNREYWAFLARWCPAAFLISGLGFLLGFGLLGVRLVTTISIPEIALAIVVIPSFLSLFLVGLPGFYQYIADSAPRLGLAGLLSAAIGGIALVVVVVGKLVLDLLGIVGFTEEGPLVALLFVILIAYFLSFVFYGVGSLLTEAPSRLVGLLLLVIISEPISGILVDLVGVEIGAAGNVIALGVAAVAILAIGYLLGSEGRMSHTSLG